jgi:Txe/YoeB family toxin of Txe-Axe toxin-antitoxin module
MKLIFTERSWEDYLWFQANERKLLKKTFSDQFGGQQKALQLPKVI